MSKIQTYSREFLQSRPKSRITIFFDYLREDKSKSLIFIPIFLLLICPLLFFPTYIPIILIVRYHAKKTGRLPFYYPAVSKIKSDPFNPSPVKGPNGERTFGPAAGIAYFGNVNITGEQVWMSNDILRQHVAYLAATGSGKTFTISGVASFNALIWGAGYIYIDAKADLDIVRMHQSPLFRMNRIDDLFVLNYIQGSRSVWDPYDGDKTTNTYNILESGTSGQNTETMKSLMQGDNDIWAKRADSLLASLIAPTTYMRDKNMITLSVPSFLNYLTIENAGSIVGDEKIPDLVKKQLAGFLKTLPGMSAPFYEEIIQGKSVKSTQVYDQWGFASMQIILVINMLAGDYGRVFGVTVGEIDLEAIVLQDRILLGLLPALEASSQSVASMGRIIMAAHKGMMGRALGECIEGSVKTNLKQRPTNAPYPYITVKDEVGMIFSEGEGASSAQARGIGQSLWYSAQDVPAMKKLGENVAKEVMTVLGNTITKISGRIIDDETFEEYSKLFDEDYVWQRDRTDIVYTDNGARATESSGSYIKEKRLNKREVEKLREGEIFIGAIDNLERVNGPNLHTSSLTDLMLNDFVPMLPYSNEDLDAIIREKTHLEAEYIQIINDPSRLNEVTPLPYSQLSVFRESLDKVYNVIKNPCSANHLAFAAYTRAAGESVSELNNGKEEFMKELAGKRNEEHRSSDNIDELHRLAKESTQPNIAKGENSSTQVQESSEYDDVVIPLSDADDGIALDFSSQTDVNALEIENDNSTNAGDSKLAILDAHFKSVGLSRENLIQDLAEIDVLSERSDRISDEIKKGVLSKADAVEKMHQEITDKEIHYATSSASRVVNELYSRTNHPGNPNPVQNKSLTIKLLKNIHRIIVEANHHDHQGE